MLRERDGDVDALARHIARSAAVPLSTARAVIDRAREAPEEREAIAERGCFFKVRG